ncbi:MAG TPA: glycerol acyltransferase, partial [Bacteroidetes bacterium]|nr:glycerol acyltransferase [Bacteroidota bacterium]
SKFNEILSIFLRRKTLRISLNLELALLPHEIFNKQNKTIRVKIGKPIPWQTFDHSKSHYDWAQYVKQEVYKLRHPN